MCQILCKPKHHYKKIENNIVVGILIFSLIITIIYYPYAIIYEVSSISIEIRHFSFICAIISIMIMILYFNWAHSWLCSTLVTTDGLFASRKGLGEDYQRIYRKGYFIPWPDITKMTISKGEESNWKCTFTTKHEDIIEISSVLKYPDSCVPKLIEIGNELKLL